MRIETRGRAGNGRAAGTLAALAMLLAVACTNDPKARTAVGDSVATAFSKSTGSDTNAATGQSATNGGSLSGTLASPARVVILGTSLTAGYGIDPSEAYPTLVQQMADSLKLHVKIVNAGLSGETSAGALRRADWVLSQPAAAVVLEVGANDGLRGVNPDSTQANIEALVEAIRRKKPEPIITLVQMEAPPNFGVAYTTRFHNAYVNAARNQHIELLPFLLDGVAGVSTLNQGDGVHPNPRGAVIVARNMFKALTPMFVKLSAAAESSTR